MEGAGKLSGTGEGEASKQTYVANEGGVDEGSERVRQERQRARHGDPHDLLPEVVPSEREPARTKPRTRKSSKQSEQEREIDDLLWLIDGSIAYERTWRPGRRR